MFAFFNCHVCDVNLPPNLVHGKKMKDIRISVDVLHFQKDTKTPPNKREEKNMFTRSRY